MSTILFPKLLEPQRPFEFPKSLTEKCLPTRIADFVGISKTKRTFLNFCEAPRPISFCLVGEQSVGKPARRLTLAKTMGCCVRHNHADRHRDCHRDCRVHRHYCVRPRSIFRPDLVAQACTSRI